MSPALLADLARVFEREARAAKVVAPPVPASVLTEHRRLEAIALTLGQLAKARHPEPQRWR